MRSLVVDDEQMGRVMLALFLKEHGDCSQATNGREGETLFAEALDAGEPFDLVCLNIEMPDKEYSPI